MCWPAVWGRVARKASMNLIATQRGCRMADTNEQLWAVVDGHEIEGRVVCEGLTEQEAKLFAASPDLLAACQAVASQRAVYQTPLLKAIETKLSNAIAKAR